MEIHVITVFHAVRYSHPVMIEPTVTKYLFLKEGNGFRSMNYPDGFLEDGAARYENKYHESYQDLLDQFPSHKIEILK